MDNRNKHYWKRGRGHINQDVYNLNSYEIKRLKFSRTGFGLNLPIPMAGPLTIAAIGFGKSMNASTNEIWLSYARWARISVGVVDTPDIIDFKSFPEE